MSYRIREAVAADQATVRRIVRAAWLNPTGLYWRRFLVADEGERIVGTVQLKPHSDGSLELASLAVVPERQSQGIGAALVAAAQARAGRELYLTCRSSLESYYQRFGFRRVAPAELPRNLGRMYVLANLILGLTRRPERLLVMRC